MCFHLSKMTRETHEEGSSLHLLILLGYLYFCCISMAVFTHSNALFFLPEVPCFRLPFPLPMGKFLYHSLQVGFLVVVSEFGRSAPMPPSVFTKCIARSREFTCPSVPVTSAEPKDAGALPSGLWKPGEHTRNSPCHASPPGSLPVACCVQVWGGRWLRL